MDRQQYTECTGCRYYRGGKSAHSMPPRVCHFCYDTGEPRGCSAEECYRNRIHFLPIDPAINRAKKGVDYLWKMNIAKRNAKL